LASSSILTGLFDLLSLFPKKLSREFFTSTGAKLLGAVFFGLDLIPMGFYVGLDDFADPILFGELLDPVLEIVLAVGTFMKVFLLIYFYCT